MPNGTLHSALSPRCALFQKQIFVKHIFVRLLSLAKKNIVKIVFLGVRWWWWLWTLVKQMLKKEHNNGFMNSAMGIQKLFWNLTSDLSISSTIWSSLFIIFDSLKIQCWNHFVVSFRTTLQHVYCLVIRAERGFVVHFQNVKVQFCKSQNKKSCKHRYYKASNLYQILKSFLCGR